MAITDWIIIDYWLAMSGWLAILDYREMIWYGIILGINNEIQLLC